jgi:cytoskeleton protein RodZ
VTEAASELETQAAPGPGALLRMAREARGTTVADVAASLKMSPRQIEAIESEDFSRLTGATFIRGFVRNYAKLLKIDAAPLLAAFEERAVLPTVELIAPINAGVKMPSTSGRAGRGYLAATVIALGILCTALAAYFDLLDFNTLLWNREGNTKTLVQRDTLPQAVLPLPPPVALVAPAPSAESTEPLIESDQQVVIKPVKPQLIFNFDGNSWVEVREDGGRIVFSQMNPTGTTQVVEGRPPFQLVVGNASRVRLYYKDQPIDLRPHTRVEVARLTLE